MLRSALHDGLLALKAAAVSFGNGGRFGFVPSWCAMQRQIVAKISEINIISRNQ
jgi:hypothetical protein